MSFRFSAISFITCINICFERRCFVKACAKVEIVFTLAKKNEKKWQKKYNSCFAV